ncbi:glutamate transporter polyphemus-like [Drosophila innubila]|uniref:glutamate transporter polyphemus-like n=1 Tax=Drosophila innubila TaxID=198719 RepID=UPI00148CCF88|nr:glutamate transporter polyphemus-like [Drosophila innubila]
MGNAIHNPYAKPVEKASLSTFDTFHFVVKSVLGFGTFYLPIAFVYTGYVGGLFCTILFTILYIYGIHLMLQCMVQARARNGNNNMTMSETVAYAFNEGSKCCRPCSKIFGYLVNILLIVVHFSIGVLYIVFSAQNLKSVANSFWDNLDIRVFIAIVIVCIVPLFLIRDVCYLSPLNITGNILILYIIVYYIYNQLISSLLQGSPVSDSSDATTIVNSDIHLYIGFVMFSLSSVGVMVAIESKMANPEAYLGWWGTLNRATCLTLIANLIWGLFMYYQMGDAIYRPFLENMPWNIDGDTIKISAAVVVILTYPLNGFVPIDIIFNQYITTSRDIKNPVRVEMIVRIIFLVLTAICALAFPMMVPVVKMICAIALPLLNLIFPACTKLSLGYESGKKWIWILLHILIIILGTLVLLCGVYCACYEITIYYLGKPIKKPFFDNAYDDVLS